jgi:hypothetical protein
LKRMVEVGIWWDLVKLWWELKESHGPRAWPPAITTTPPRESSDEVSRGEKIALRGTDPESYITEYTLVYEDERIERTSNLASHDHYAPAAREIKTR